MSLRSFRSADHYHHCHHCIIVILINVVIISMVIDVIVLIIIVIVTIIITNVIIIVIIIIIFGTNMLFATKNTGAKLKSHLWFLSVNYPPYQTISHLVLQRQLIIISRISG